MAVFYDPEQGQLKYILVKCILVVPDPEFQSFAFNDIFVKLWL